MAGLMFNKVLVPSDFSEHAHRAVDYALDLVADPSGLTILHVVPPMNTFSVGDPAIAWHTVSDETRQENLYQTFREHFKEPKYQEVNFEVAFGSPVEEITRYAQDHSTELILLPSHGRTGLTRVMIGSVAERVVRQAHCPVLVLRD